jgi:phosphoadenosine phosphosulfate reductase
MGNIKVSTTTDTEIAGWEGLDAADVLRRAIERFHPRLAIASSFSMEDNLLVHLAVAARPDARVFALDTGRLPEETLACADAISRRYGVRIEWYHPRHDAVETLVRAKGMYSFRESVENRRECCHLRKVEPLGRALAGLDAWITGLRRGHGPTRATIPVAERDAAHGGILKLSPLAAWTTDQVRAFTAEHRIPVNRLYQQGYASIGCAPCTRAIQPGEDERAGRWWWENPEHKECGLHR